MLSNSKRELQSGDIQVKIQNKHEESKTDELEPNDPEFNSRRDVKNTVSKKVSCGFFYITVWTDLPLGWAPWNGSPRP